MERAYRRNENKDFFLVGIVVLGYNFFLGLTYIDHIYLLIYKDK